MSNKLKKECRREEVSCRMKKTKLTLKDKRHLFILLGLFIGLSLIIVWIFLYIFIYSHYHNELGAKVLRCENFTTLNLDKNGVFTWSFDNRPNDKLNGVMQIYFGDNAIKFIENNYEEYNLTRDTIYNFFDVDYTKENFFAMKIYGFIYDTNDSVTGHLQ